MKGVELYGRVRYAVQIEGLSHREAARRFGIDPRTVAKMMFSRCRPDIGAASRRRDRSWTEQARCPPEFSDVICGTSGTSRARSRAGVAQGQLTTLPRLGSRVRIPSPAPIKSSGICAALRGRLQVLIVQNYARTRARVRPKIGTACSSACACRRSRFLLRRSATLLIGSSLRNQGGFARSLAEAGAIMRRSSVGSSGRVCSDAPADSVAPLTTAAFSGGLPSTLSLPRPHTGLMKVQRFPAAHKPEMHRRHLPRERIPTARLPERGLRESEDHEPPYAATASCGGGAAGHR